MKVILVAPLAGAAIALGCLFGGLAGGAFGGIAFIVLVGFATMGRAQFADRPLAALGAMALAALAMIIGLPGAAFAQTSTTTISVGDIWAGLAPYILAAIGAVITFLVGAVLNLLKTKLGLSVDDSMRASLQTAAINGAGLVLNKLGNQLSGTEIDVKNQFVAEAVNYVLKAAPDAIKHFGLTPEAIAQKIVALLPQVANTTITAAPAK